MSQNKNQETIGDILDGNSEKIFTSPLQIEKNNSLDEYLFRIQNSNFEKKEIAYIDKDVHEVIRLLKRNLGINIGDFFSLLGEDFIKRHNKDIQELNNKNKYFKR